MPSPDPRFRPDPGQTLSPSLPCSRECVIPRDMLWLAAAAMAATTPQSGPSQPVRAVVQAQATVRIISAVRIRLDGQPSADVPPPTEAVIHTEGSLQTAQLIEFQ